MKSRERMGSSSSAGFGAFRENEVHIFYYAGGSFGEIAGVFLSRKHSPNALCGGTGRWLLASGVVSGAAECTGRTGESPVLSVLVCRRFGDPLCA